MELVGRTVPGRAVAVEVLGASPTANVSTGTMGPGLTAVPELPDAELPTTPTEAVSTGTMPPGSGTPALSPR